MELEVKVKEQLDIKCHDIPQESSDDGEVIYDRFKLINSIDFVVASSWNNYKKVNILAARWLRNKHDVEILWCSVKKDGREYTSYLANLNEGKGHELRLLIDWMKM